MPKLSRMCVGVVACVGVLVTGCGLSTTKTTPTATPVVTEAGKTASEILNDARAAFNAASSVHVSAQLFQSGQDMSIDMDLGQGATASGSMTVSGITMNFAIVGGKAYFQGKDFLAKVAGADAADFLGDNWVQASLSDPRFKSVPDFFSKDKWVTNVFPSTSSVSLTKGHAQDVNGTETMTVNDSTDTFYVATKGTPYPLRIVSSGSTTGEIDFTNYGTSGTVTPPPDPVALPSSTPGV